MYALRIVFDRRGETKLDSKKKALVHIEVVEKSKTRQKRYISTGVKILTTQYSPNGGFSVKNHPNAMVLKSKVLEVYNKVEAFIHSENCTQFDDIYNWDKVDEANEAKNSFLVFFEQEMARKTTTKDSWKNHRTLYNTLVRFKKIINFTDLTYENIVDFDVYIKEKVKSQPVIYKRHQMLRSYIKEARKRKITKMNPYEDFEFKKGKSKSAVFLEENEIKKILKYKPANEKMQRIKDMYVFQCFTGLAFVDMQYFSKSAMSISNSHQVIRSNRIKTDETYIVPILPEAKEIIEKYDYKFPKISNQKYNDYIKVIATHVGIEKTLTSHTARHRNYPFRLNVSKLQEQDS